MNKYPMVKLGDICEIVSGGTPSRSNMDYWKDGNIPWVKISDFKGKYLNTTTEFITSLGLENSSAKLLKKGTILFTIFATLGEVSILNIEASTNQAIAGIRIIDNTVDENYLYYYLCSLKKYVNNIGRGVAQSNINMSILKSFEIPLPPIEEQRHIAEVLDKVTAQIDNCKKILQNLDLLVKSKFVQMFGDPVSNPMGWEIYKIQEVAPIEQYKGNFEEKNIWLLNLDAIEPQTGNILFKYICDIENIGNSTICFNEDNILYSKLRPYLNKVVIPFEKGYATSELLPLKPKKCLNKYYLTYFLRSNEFVKYINEKVAGAKMPRVVVSDFKKYNIPVPPIELQNQFAEFVENVEKQKTTTQNTLNQLETLKNALMQKYFN